MLSLLVLLGVGCGVFVGTDTNVFDACLTAADILCDCGESEGWANTEWACDTSETVPMCAEEAAEMGDEWLDWFNCVNAEFAKECDGDAAEAACERPA